MGKIIVKNIKGMNWKARIGLIAMFTLAFSVLIYQGWNQLRSADAAIGESAWITLYNNATAYPNSASVSYTPLAAASNKNRLLVVAVSTARSANGSQTATISFGGRALTLANGNLTLTSVRQHSAIYYLKEADIVTALGGGASANFALTVGGGTANGTIIYAKTLSNVDQNAPISFSQIMTSTTTTTSAPTFASALNTNANDKSIAIVNSFRTGSGTARTLTTVAANWTQPTAGQAGNVTNVSGTTYAMRAIALTKAIPTVANSSTTPATTMSGTSLMAMTGISVKAATTALGNGIDAANANVAPGSANQKLDGFSFVTSSAGTTDSVTGLTVTTTNPTAIASMSIWNEAGTTQYFTTVTNPAASQAFSGGTPIPVTSTSANYKIVVTYKVRATAPSGNTVTNASVSAYTCTNIQATGTDAAGTTLTLLNTHAASTWGTCTPGDARIILNWTYGTPGQTALIIRYTANTDTTKPVDGTTYGLGSVFGTGGTVVYYGTLATYTNTGLTNNTTYYYKIFEYDTYRNYYNASDVWTPPLTPAPSDPTPPVVAAGFAATSPVNTVDIPITSFSATDAFPGVSGYMITTSATQPNAGDAGWVVSPPEIFTVAGQGNYTLYPWAKDGSGNVSALYASPSNVIVDLTSPSVSAFTVNTPVASRNIPIGSFTAADTGGSSLAAYMITTSSTPPAVDDLGWLTTSPSAFSVATDGSHTLYPWVKDNAGNVSPAFASPRTVIVDTTAPVGLDLLTPLDEAVNLPPATTLSCNPATDSSGGVMYQFTVTGDAGYSQNSGWQTGTTYAPPALVKGNQYLWSVKAKDALGNETASTATRTFSIIAPCVRNNPNLILLTPGGNKAGQITTDSGIATYNLRLINNDTGDCGSTTFNLSTNDVDLGEYFEDSLFDNGLTTKSVTLATNSEINTPVTIRSMPGEDSGDGKTTVRSLDPNHTPESGPAYFESGWVLTNLNVVTCVPKAPLMIVGPDSGYLNKGGKMLYTITVRNNDVGAGCTPVTFNLSIPTESNSTDFNASQLNPVSLLLNSGELKSTTLTVSAKAAAAKGAVNNTTVAIAAAGHESPGNVTVISTVNNPMLHNSDNISSTRWGGWGVPGKRYGEIDCETCHVGGGGDTANIKRVEERIFTPYTTGTAVRFPGHNKPVAYRRYDGTKSSQPVLGWDAGATPRTTSTRVCEVCHTYDAAATNGVKAHPYNSNGATLGNHYSTDGTDCTRCHKHNKGFGTANMACNACHGNSAVETITVDNRYVIAPPNSASGATGTITGKGQVSNNPKVGAHQTHLQLFNGFNSYSTVDYRCQSCHGALPVGLAHASDNSLPAFQGMAVRGGVSASFNSTSLTCSTYCHNPAASTVLKNAINTGSKVFPSWTSARLLGDTRKTQANCGVCHKSPGDAGFEPAASHTGMTITNTSCTVCHGHDGDDQGIAGRRHMDGYFFGGTCNGCHGYENGTWAAAAERIPAISQGKGSHEKHIAYLVAQWGGTLNPNSDGFGSGAAWTNVCGVCHAGSVHTVGEAFGGTGRTIAFPAARQFGPLTPVYNGNPATGSATNLKTCSNLDCHYKVTPVWSTY